MVGTKTCRQSSNLCGGNSCVYGWWTQLARPGPGLAQTHDGLPVPGPHQPFHPAATHASCLSNMTNIENVNISYKQCCGATTFLGGSSTGSGSPGQDVCRIMMFVAYDICQCVAYIGFVAMPSQVPVLISFFLQRTDVYCTAVKTVLLQKLICID